MAKKPLKDKRPAPFRWRPFLEQVSRELLKDVRTCEDLPDDVVASGFLGFEGATDEQIAALEKRLGVRLPPTYRTFLAETNGWRNCGPFIDRLWPCSKVRWFRERNQDWIDAYLHPGESGISIASTGANTRTEPQPITNEGYLVYDDTQNPCLFRPEDLRSALEISDVGDSAILLLNPNVVNQDGEWEAWLFAYWMPGARRYSSFLELMQAEHQSFQRLRKDFGPNKSKHGNSAQQAARRGETTKAISMLRKLAANGDDSSAVSLAELCAFRGVWNQVVANLGRVISNLGAVRDFENYQGNLLRLLGRAGHETGQWEQIANYAFLAIAAEEERVYDRSSEYARSRFIAWFKNLELHCQRRGGPPHELVNIFGVLDPIEGLSEFERRDLYERGQVEEYALVLRDNPSEYARHRFALARNLELDEEMIKIFEEFPALIYFDDALEVSRTYMRKGNPEAAWSVLRDRLHQSVGGLPEQVAPIILLIDDTLRPLMSRERCELVLSTRRGWEATENQKERGS